MLKQFFHSLLGDENQSKIKKIEPIVKKVNTYYEEYKSAKLNESQIQAKTAEFKERYQHGVTVDELLPEAFGLVKYACEYLVGHSWEVRGDQKAWDMVPYDVQIIGGTVLHQGNISEMKTGEGKTLVCTMPAYLNALTGKGVFIVTVNEYLAQRDAEWMSGLYKCLGLSVGTILNKQTPTEKQAAYNCDITYGTNNEFGFDYLRDNMASSKFDIVQRNLHYAIVDEVDSILIDEARTPLIISAPAEAATDKYQLYAQLVRKLQENVHYNIDEKQKTATLTEEGIAKMEQLLGIENIYTEAGYQEVHHIEQSLRAANNYKVDQDYVVSDGQIVIVDEFTGRLMAGRRYSDGLHQAIEAKEGVEVMRESKTLATVTFQNFFRLFEKLAGMTGTADTEKEEFYKIYGLDTVVIPTNKPVARQDLADNIYRTQKAKYIAITEKVKELHQKGQPVLIGTVSVEQSEILSQLFKVNGIKHEVLNAKQNDKEAEIVAQAGQKKAVTIATNMAGRGTDIKISKEVYELGGLYVIGSEKHESRRIDNQLRGRSGRQGDPGTSQFYISMEDNVMRVFGGDKIKQAMTVLNLPDDVPITNPLITKAILSAQKRVEGYNFDIRKHVVEYDDVMNYHREIVYKKRREILFGKSVKNEILLSLEQEAETIVLNNRNTDNSLDYNEICQSINAIHNTKEQKITTEKLNKYKTEEELISYLKNYLWESYEQLEKGIENTEYLRELERQLYLRSIDSVWMQHIDEMQHLRKRVSLLGYGQKNPLIEYKRLGYDMFLEANAAIKRNVANTIFKLDIAQIISSKEFLKNYEA